ncbi:MAG: 1-acyl-sn-glycerol-3-phosphate acyltransferase [Desulfohalobiaceae bacterium]|nr:1-acyl-sn-glycerol-3-phosphate acyltransferase [Desulfohalobiaceae bacterium]
MFRAVFTTLFFIPFFLLFTLLIIVCIGLLAVLPGTGRLMRDLELFWARGVVFAAGIQLETQGLELKQDTHYLFIGNHQSWLDIPVFLSALAPFRPRFVAKESLFSIPLFGNTIRRVGHLTINRDNNRKGMRDIQEAAERIKQGDSILIFPEGTRNRSSRQLQDFHIGAFVLALKSEQPLVPIIVQGTGKVLQRGSLMIRPGKVRVRAAAPIRIRDDYTVKQRTQLKKDIRAVMQDLLTETTV